MNILLIDDHELFRDGMALLLAELEATPNVIEAGSFEAGLSTVEAQTDVDLVLLDLALPGLCDIEALQALQNKLPNTPIIVLSGNNDGNKVEQVLKLGARGFITKSSSTKLMLNAVQLVLDGGTYIPPDILLASKKKELESKVYPQLCVTGLTPRQLEVLHGLADGKSNKAIASSLSLTESTVRAHVAAILKALGASNRTEAVKHAMQNGMITMPN